MKVTIRVSKRGIQNPVAFVKVIRARGEVSLLEAKAMFDRFAERGSLEMAFQSEQAGKAFAVEASELGADVEV